MPRTASLTLLLTALFSPTACATGRVSDRPPQRYVIAEGVVEVVNGTTQAYRMALVADQTVIELGTVSAQETRVFALSHGTLFGHALFRLVAITRDFSARRESEQFGLERGNNVRWTLDATNSNAVRVR